MTESNFDKKEKNITEKINIGDIIKYIPRNKDDKNFGLEAKVLKITKKSNNSKYDIKFTNPILGNITEIKG